MPLALVGGLWSLGVAVSEPFLNAYLWSAGSGWAGIAWFKLSQYVAMVLVFPVAGWLARRAGPRLPLRVAAAAVGTALALTAWLGGAAQRHLLGLGLLLGAGWALYWLAQLVLAVDLTVGAWRDRWQGLLRGLGRLAGVVAPLAAGGVVAALGRPRGFTWLFVAGLALLAASALASLALPPPGPSPPDAVDWRLALPGRRRDRDWSAVLLAHLALAWRDGVFFFVPALLIFTLSGSALDMGAYLAGTQALSLTVCAVHARWGGPGLRRASLLAGCAGATAAAVLLCLGSDLAFVWGFGWLATGLQPLLRVPAEAVAVEVIGRRPELRVERTVVKEVSVNAARALSVAALLLVVEGAGPGGIRWWLVATSAAPWLAWLSLRGIAAPRDRLRRRRPSP